MAKTSSPERWHTFKSEAVAVLAVAGGLTTALWIRRILERLTHSKVLDPNVLKNGLTPNGTSTITNTPPTAPPQNGNSSTISMFGHREPLSREHTEEPGRQYIAGRGWVSYRQKVKTSDGYILFDHNTQLNDDHLGPCPLLHTDLDCSDCPWRVDAGPYHWEPKCAALVKLHEEPREGMSLSGVRRQLEGSI
jgi:hypothetical protein